MVKCLECREYSRVVGFSSISVQKLGQNISIKFPGTEFFSSEDKLDSTPPSFSTQTFCNSENYLVIILRQI